MICWNNFNFFFVFNSHIVTHTYQAFPLTINHTENLIKICFWYMFVVLYCSFFFVYQPNESERERERTYICCWNIHVFFFLSLCKPFDEIKWRRLFFCCCGFFFVCRFVLFDCSMTTKCYPCVFMCVYI